MKLYKILELHGAPKDSVTLIKTFVVAESDKDIFEYIAEDYSEWSEDDFNDYKNEEFETFEEFKKDIMENCGDLDSDAGWDDAYYGVTKFGWECLCDITVDEIKVLKKLKILK